MAWQHSSSGRRKRRLLFGLGALSAALVVAVPFAWASHQFTDVPDSNPFHTEISNLAGSGITAGKTCVPTPGTPPTFCPNEPVVRQAMAAFLNRGLGRASLGNTIDAPLPANGDLVELANLTVDVGGAPGGTQFVKVDAVVDTYIESETGCPCGTAFAIWWDGLEPDADFVSNTMFNVNDSVATQSGFGDDTGALTAVVAAPTGTTQTFRVFAARDGTPPFTGEVSGYADMSAITGAFGSTGSSSLSGGKVGGGRQPRGDRAPGQ